MYGFSAQGKSTLFMSYFGNNFLLSVPRYKKVKISGLDENSEPVEWTVSGWTARVVQHEFDHLQVENMRGKFDILPALTSG